MKQFALLLSFLTSFLANQIFAQGSRSDTIDIIHHLLNLDMSNVGNFVISGNCLIRFSPKMNGIQKISLDFESLTVDSLSMNGSPLNYTHANNRLNVNFPNALNSTDTAELIVYYQGHPRKDPSGWGGFYFTSTGYTYNLGVAIADDPHNYGRIWFPCFDNFKERATYEFNITSLSNLKPHCNGALLLDTIVSGFRQRRWVMNEEIPSYLACIAMANYETVHQNFQGMHRTIPVELVAVQADTQKLKNSFIHLDTALAIFEQSYGPYEWNKIGYSLVPFNQGAMEHATNITFPRSSANGSLNSENLMAHEFAHSWWGNLVTCETASDMWINEGMASYSEHLFLEKAYNYATAINKIKANHKDIVQFLHLRENGYRAISGVPTQYTYSGHVYNKGASVAHNMRAYLGDSLFFVGLQSIIANNKFQNLNSYQFRDQLTLATGINMSDFFNDWVFAPGFSHFNVDSIVYSSVGANVSAEVFVQQKLRGAPHFHQNTPLELSVYDANLNRYQVNIRATGQFSRDTVLLPFVPAFYILNEGNKLNQARTDEQLKFMGTVNQNLNRPLVKNFIALSSQDTSLIQMEHHFVAPDSIKNNPMRHQLSVNRYWTFNGKTAPGFSADFRLEFNSSSSTGFLDNDLLGSLADTIILMHRSSAADDWTEFPYYTATRISVNSGYMDVDSLIFGEYAFAIKGGLSNHLKETNTERLFEVFPNPASEYLNITCQKLVGARYQLYSLSGQLLKEGILKNSTRISTSELPKGNYLLNIYHQQEVWTEKVVVE